MSRAEEFGDEHPICKLPDADERVVGCFREVGPFLNVGSGPYPLTWQEINAYSDGYCIGLTAWEKGCISTMSRLYCSYLNIGKEPSEPPYQRDFDEDDMIALNKSINKILAKEEQAFGALEA